MTQVFLKEFNSFLNSLIGYLVVGIFLVAMGLLMWVSPDTSVLNDGYANMDTLFQVGPYIFLFLIPAITMRTFAEEKKLGTLELLMTKPVTESGIVMGKFLAAFLLVLVSLLPTLVYYLTLVRLGNPQGNIDTPGVMGSYIGMALLGGVFCAIGLLASSLSTNQIVSFIIGAFLCYLFYAGFESASSLFGGGESVLMVREMGIVYHYQAMSKGLIDSRDLMYFFTVGGLMLLFTKVVLSSRSW
jgi:ABC-2 type transport system permease protein